MKSISNVTRAKPIRQAADADTCGVSVLHLDAVRRARALLPSPASVNGYAELLGLLANATRLKILLALQPEPQLRMPELCVCDLAAVTGASKSMTSHQFRLLRTAGLVLQRRAGKLVFYRLANESLGALLRSASGIVVSRETAGSSIEEA